MNEPPRRRWLRFSWRTFLALVTVMCVGLGWVGVQLKWIKDRREAIELIERSGDYHIIGEGVFGGQTTYGSTLREYQGQIDPAAAPRSLRLFGAGAVDLIHLPMGQDKEADKKLHSKLVGLFPEATVIVDGVDAD